MSAKHVLIIGSGSVGKRHARNLAALGCTISCSDPRSDRRSEMRAQLPLVGDFADEITAMSATSYDGVVIGSPPPFHVAQSARALSAGVPVLLEKPVCADLVSAEHLALTVARSQTALLLSYTWRWWLPLAEVRSILKSQAIGQLRHVHFHMSAHLADWHPWERYQDFFMAKRALGGGALLDESHWLDLMIWFFGMPAEVSGRIEKISDLEIETDDNVDLLLSYADGKRVTMHLDLYGRPHEKFIRFVGSNGTLLWTADPNRIAVGRGQLWEQTDYTGDRNDMFVAVAKEFLDVMNGGAVRTCTVEDGVRVLRVIEAARTASHEGRSVSIVNGL